MKKNKHKHKLLSSFIKIGLIVLISGLVIYSTNKKSNKISFNDNFNDINWDI